MAIWYQLKKAGEPGLTLEQLIPLVEIDVPRGYAWRRYVHWRGDLKLRQTVPRRASAVAYIVRASLTDMVKRGSAAKLPTGAYTAIRKPRSAMAPRGIDDDLDGSVTRHHVQVMEAMRVLRELLERGTLRSGEQDALRLVMEATQLQGRE